MVDPYGKIQQLSTPKNALAQIQVVGPPIAAPAAGRGRLDGQLQPVPAPGLGRLHRHQPDDDHDDVGHDVGDGLERLLRGEDQLAS